MAKIGAAWWWMVVVGWTAATAACGGGRSETREPVPLYPSARFDVRARWGAIATADLWSITDELADVAIAFRIENRGRRLVVRAREARVLARGRVRPASIIDGHAVVTSWITREVRVPIALPEGVARADLDALCVTWSLLAGRTPVFEETSTFVAREGRMLYMPDTDLCVEGSRGPAARVVNHRYYRADPL